MLSCPHFLETGRQTDAVQDTYNNVLQEANWTRRLHTLLRLLRTQQTHSEKPFTMNTDSSLYALPFRMKWVEEILPKTHIYLIQLYKQTTNLLKHEYRIGVCRQETKLLHHVTDSTSVRCERFK